MFDITLLAQNIKKYRKSKRFSQTELGEKLFVTGQTISKWERGTSLPEIDKICMLAEILGVSLDVMFGFSAEHESLMVGIDGGGTKTEYIVFDKDGKIYERVLTEGSNPNFYGREKVCESIKENISSLIEIRPRIKGVFVGSAGFYSGDNAEYVRAYLKKAFPALKIRCAGDIMNAVASGTDEEKCICSISGTGNITFVYRDDTLTRYGGYGYLFDKAGSGYDLGRDALYTALREADGLGEKSLVTDLVESRLGGRTFDSVQSLYNADVSYIASFSQIVFHALEKGDAVAQRIIENNTEYIANIINTAYKNNPDCHCLVLTGSLYKNDYFYNSVCKKLDPGLKPICSAKPQVYGACILCCKMMGYATDGLKKNFSNEYELLTNGGKCCDIEN